MSETEIEDFFMQAGRIQSMIHTGEAPCQLCGEVAPLTCGPSRFGPETLACDQCWNPSETSSHTATECK